MTRASALDLRGTFLGRIQRVWVCIVVSVSKSAVTRAPTMALHETGTSSPSPQFGVVGTLFGSVQLVLLPPLAMPRASAVCPRALMWYPSPAVFFPFLYL
jgi:hypothetical protein